MSYRRRRRREYTPEQRKATDDLGRAERWANILAAGIGDNLKMERYGCVEGLRELIEHVNTKLGAAVDAVEAARVVHDAAFERHRRVLVRDWVPNPPGARKAKPAKKRAAKA